MDQYVVCPMCHGIFRADEEHLCDRMKKEIQLCKEQELGLISITDFFLEFSKINRVSFKKGREYPMCKALAKYWRKEDTKKTEVIKWI